MTSLVSHLSEVPPVEGHAVVPEVLEEVWQDLLLDVLRLHAVRHAALLHHLGEGEDPHSERQEIVPNEH